MIYFLLSGHVGRDRRDRATKKKARPPEPVEGRCAHVMVRRAHHDEVAVVPTHPKPPPRTADWQCTGVMTGETGQRLYVDSLFGG